MKFPKLRLPGPKVLLPLVIVVAGGLLAVGLVLGRKPPERITRPTLPPVVRVVEVAFTDARLDVRSQGQVSPRIETTLVAQVPGPIVRVSESLVAGGFFRANEPLATIEPTDFRLAVKTAEAGVARAELRVAREEKEAEIARLDWGELGEGRADPLVLREPQLAEARAELASARALAEKARLDLARTHIQVPYDGRVLEKLVGVGQYVAPGTPVARVYATDAAEVRLPVPADQIAYLRVSPEGRPDGAAGVVLRANYGGRMHEWAGRVVRTEGAIDPRTRTVTVVARVDDPFRAATDSFTPLTVGLFVEAVIEGRSVSDVVVLPRAALRGEADVFVVDAEETLRLRHVDVLRVDRETVVIRGGLEEGDLVCISQIEVAVDGMPVRVQRPEGDR